jgi:hypothetical protein
MLALTVTSNGGLKEDRLCNRLQVVKRHCTGQLESRYSQSSARTLLGGAIPRAQCY